jgi:hypothetical protein
VTVSQRKYAAENGINSSMKISYLALLTSIAIAAVAAWFSIAGLITIFSASAASIAIMASVLEVGKLVTASWLYRNWKETTFLLRTYLTLAVLILMFITSMGIFGYLSKSHLDQAAPVLNNSAQVERLDSRISREQQKIENTERVLGQLDSLIETLIEYDKISGPSGAIAVQETQAEPRVRLNNAIDSAQASITSLETEKFELTSQIRAIELEVGPVKYIAELLYDDPDSSLDQAVQLVILIIVLVFDPLAVLLLIAANQSLLRTPRTAEPEKVDTVPVPPPVNTKPVNTKPVNTKPAESESGRPVKKVPKEPANGFEARNIAARRASAVGKQNPPERQ